MYKTIEISVENRIAEVKLNRPDKRNALNDSMVLELTDAFKKLEQDPAVKVIVLSGNGKAFCAGADLAYLEKLQKNTYEENLADSRQLMTLFDTIYHLNKVVIAKVTGHAIAGGAGLATLCDLVYSVPEAKYGYTEVKIGFVPALVSVFLLRKCGESVAKDLLLTGRLLDASEAKNLGCINELFEASEIEEKVREIAKNLCNQASGDSLRLTKRLLARVQNETLLQALDTAAACNASARATEDCKKGISSFLNKEAITW
ncbi:MAG: enoyl-CoA hydratase/isomerase family protein [Luteibaculum sp.]